MKILQVCPFFYPVVGGLERAVLELSKQLLSRGHHVTVFTSDLAGPFNRHLGEQHSVVEGIEVFRFKTVARLGQFAAFWPGFLPMLEQGPFDVVHVHSYRHPHAELALIGARRARAKVILQPHWPAHPRGLFQRAVVAGYDLVRGRWFLSSGDLVVALTPLEELWLRAMRVRRIEILPNGIPAHLLQAPPSHRFSLPQSSGQFLLVSLGRTDRMKGFHLVIEALARVSGIRYAIAGAPGDFYAELLSLICSLGIQDRVSLLGQLAWQDVVSVLDQADAYVQPSFFEAFSVATLEAMARGKPCAGSRAGGLAWLLEECGLLFAPGDVEGIAQCLLRLRDDESLRASLGERARSRASELTWDKVGERYERILESVIREGPH